MIPGIKTVREVALERLCIWISKMQEGVAPDGTLGGENAHAFTPDLVLRGPLTEHERGARKLLAIGITEGDERKVPGTGLGNFTATLPIQVEWFSAMLATSKEDASEVNNAVLGEIQRRVLSNRQLENVIGDGSGIVQRIREVANHLDIDDYKDKQIGGVIEFDMVYKHDELDPRRPLPSGVFLADPMP